MLETTRIAESLSLGTGIVISESAKNINEFSELKNLIDVIETDDIRALNEVVSRYLQNDELWKARINRNLKLINSSAPTAFEYYFYRFLLATDNIDFDQFYQLAGDYIKPHGNFWVLGLPEAIERHKSFDETNEYGIEYIPGLRHYHGWVGCGLSYKFMLRKAADNGLDYTIICEDDVELFRDFSIKFPLIMEYLLPHVEKWDVFSGLIADVNPDTVVNNIAEFKGLELITIHKMVSMVFNIYNKTFLTALENWNSSNRDANSNTIDRLIENSLNVKVITILPWLVGQKDDLKSTLWKFQNTQYNNVIDSSASRLLRIIDNYKISHNFYG